MRLYWQVAGQPGEIARKRKNACNFLSFGGNLAVEGI
jgi:hypothetical protein